MKKIKKISKIKDLKKKVIEKNQIQIIVNLFIKTYIIQNNYNYYKI